MTCGSIARGAAMSGSRLWRRLLSRGTSRCCQRGRSDEEVTSRWGRGSLDARRSRSTGAHPGGRAGRPARHASGREPGVRSIVANGERVGRAWPVPLAPLAAVPLWGIGTWALAVALRPHLSTRAGQARHRLPGCSRPRRRHGLGLRHHAGRPAQHRRAPGSPGPASSGRPGERCAVPQWVLGGFTSAAHHPSGPDLACRGDPRGLARPHDRPGRAGLRRSVSLAAPATLPPGVFKLAGWADRLIVVSNCLWAAALAWRVAGVARSRSPQAGATHAAVRATAAPASTAS